ncbi:methyl-accepting chemotaxis protein [Marinomonas sp. C2222]|uniref:Methyl-accepting chemotaxis protein n=1 Tax=Marinomonas sargassi TaxID=2984494 RepID=A0ABT2YR93_9GAMM|nr:methyl-accepting chemotaxis protein [Marinomonas sargassi]MCV2402409.1 methyl-accepting chemotaxis protein [Marinomonas sargassi]
MLSKIRKVALPKQLGFGVLIFVSLIFVVLMAVISELFTNKIDSIVTTHQLKEAELIANQLSESYYTLKTDLQHSSDFLNSQLKDVQIVADKPILLEGAEMPTLRLRYQRLNGHSTFMKNFTKTSGFETSIIYQKSGVFYRIAHSQKGISNTLADGVISQSLQADKAYIGKIMLGNKSYIALYSSLSNLPNFFSEILIPYEQVLSPLTVSINKMKFGKDGYVYVSDGKLNRGELIIHPTLTGESLFSITGGDTNVDKAFSDMYEASSGVVYYTLDVQGINSVSRESKVIFRAVPGWDWVVSLKTYSDEYQEDVNSILYLIALVSLVSSVALTAILWFLIRRALKPLQALSKGLSQLGQGNLAFEFPNSIDDDSKNEIDLLQRDAVLMRDNLVRLVNKIHLSSLELVKSTQSISESSVDLRGSATTSQGACLHVASSISQMSSSIEEVSHSASLVSQESQNVRSSTEKGNQAVKSVEQTVAQLSSAFGQASETIKMVEESSSNIGNVVNVINEIAEQTNLLALNAAIEAARAGEQGRGFAVVADEVRVLAQRTQQSTEEIQKVVETLQRNSKSAVQDMEDGGEQVKRSVDLAKEAGKLLETIYDSIKVVESGVGNVAATTEEQSVASTEIRQNAISLEEAATETLQQADNTQGHSDDIRAIADGLKKDLAVFTLK